MQTFTLLAGPNGAGKSTLAAFLFNETEYFNGDIVREDVEKEYKANYPNYCEPRYIEGAVASTLEKRIILAIHEKRDFAFETNFSNDMAMFVTSKFKDAGYKTKFVFLGLDELQESISRVEQRASTGGHNVSREYIEFNFHEGYKRANENMSFLTQ